MIDHEHNVSLYTISSRGFELAERYRDDAGLSLLPPALQRTLIQVAEQREALMEAFGKAVIGEGGLPKAGNPERELFENLIDRWYSSHAGARQVVERLRRADQAWQEEIDQLCRDSGWPPSLRQVLEALLRHIQASRTLLGEVLEAERPSAPTGSGR